MISDLFDKDVRDVQLAPGAMLLGEFARRFEAPCVTALRRIVEVAPGHHPLRGGHRINLTFRQAA